MLQLLAYLLFEQFAFSFFEALRWVALKSLKPLASRKYSCHSQKHSVPVLSAEHLRLFFAIVTPVLNVALLAISLCCLTS